MASDAKPVPGPIGWIDLTVPDADGVCDVDRDVTGWTPVPVSMGDYQDYCMNAANGQSVAGICLDAALQLCQTRGGKLSGTPMTVGDGSRFCPIQDPAGAIAALYESWSQAE